MSEKDNSINSEVVHQVFNKLDTLDKNVDSINVTLAKQSVILDEHVKRTNLLEEDLEPIRVHVNRVNSIIAFLGALLASAGAISGIIKLLSML